VHPVSHHVRIGAVVKGDQIRGTTGQANELQLLVNQEARGDRLLPDYQPWDSIDGVGTQSSGSPAGEQAVAVWTTSAQSHTG